MLEIKYIKLNVEIVKNKLLKRKFHYIKYIDRLLEIHDIIVQKKKQCQLKQKEHNLISKYIINHKYDLQKFQLYKNNARSIKLEIDSLSNDIKYYEKIYNNIIIQIPNLPDNRVPDGNLYSDNKVIYCKKTKIDVNVNNLLYHWEIGEKYDIIDFKTSSKMSGNGFVFFKNKGALLQRALINFFLDSAVKENYQVIDVPLLVNNNAVWGTGQIPDKDNQMYYIEKDYMYLIPTSEVSLINLYANKNIKYYNLPIKLTSVTPCFRREAGSYGKNTKGLNRLHQFYKVELVQLTDQESSFNNMNNMISYIKYLLEQLQLPYRILLLCGGELGYTSAITYDIEVYSIKQGKWLEVSSISNCLTYQSHRLKIFYNNINNKKLVHTINGSGLALPRIIATILENNQSDNGILIPKCLIKYTGFKLIN